MQDPPIVCDGVLVIVGGGDVDETLMQELGKRGACLVGADGGGDVIAAAGLVPDAIIGDLDSLRDPTTWSTATRVIRIDEQDTTDFEKAVYATAAPVTVALGMTGGRFDHTLAALHVVQKHTAARPIILVDRSDLAAAVTGSFSFSVDAGERVSIYPLEPVTFSGSTGLAFPLDGIVLAVGERIGTSNAALSGPFTITPADKTPYLIIMDRGHIFDLIEAMLKGG